MYRLSLLTVAVMKKREGNALLKVILGLDEVAFQVFCLAVGHGRVEEEDGLRGKDCGSL